LLLTKEGQKIVYSGDTLPCTNLLNYAQSAKVLIHEATFDDSLVADAAAKKHTTTGQAIALG
jgi:ribonuclease Z